MSASASTSMIQTLANFDIPVSKCSLYKSWNQWISFAQAIKSSDSNLNNNHP